MHAACQGSAYVNGIMTLQHARRFAGEVAQLPQFTVCQHACRIPIGRLMTYIA